MSKAIYTELKEVWRKAKVQAGDFRGLAHTRFRNCETDAAAMKVAYTSLTRWNGERYELQMEINETGRAWTWKELIREIESEPPGEITIDFTVNVWNKKRTDADNRHLSTYKFTKTL